MGDHEHQATSVQELVQQRPQWGRIQKIHAVNKYGKMEGSPIAVFARREGKHHQDSVMVCENWQQAQQVAQKAAHILNFKKMSEQPKYVIYEDASKDEL